MRWRNLSIVAVLAAAALAGCTGDGGEEDVDALEVPGPTIGEEVPLGTGQALRPANLSAIDPVVIEESGSLGYDALFDLGPYDETEGRHVVSDRMPPGAAMRLEANLTWEPSATGANSVYFYLAWQGDAVSEYIQPEYDSGEATLSALLRPAGSGEVTVVVWRNCCGSQEPAVEYNLHVSLTPYLDVVPREAVAAVAVPEGGFLVVEPADGTEGRLLIYDGHDALLEPLQVEGRTIVVENASRAAEYVLLAPDDDLVFRVMVAQDAEAADPVLRHLPVVWEWGPVEALDDAGSFPLRADRPPLRVGARVGHPDGEELEAVWNAEVAVTDPDGAAVVSGTWSCICYGTNTLGTPFGDDALVAGEYMVTYSSEASYNADIQGFAALYQR